MLAIKSHHSVMLRQQAGSYKRIGAEHGFTLVELIMVIALAGIVAVMISTVMSRPLQGFADQSRRAELTDLAAMALNRMARDIRLAVPNLLVVSSNEVRLVPIAAAGRYRANQPDPDGPRQDPPACTQASGACSIDILSPIEPASATTPHWLIIYNTSGLAGLAEAQDGDNSAISPKAFTWKDGTLSTGLSDFRFQYASPQKRFYLANEAVTYRCTGDELLRESSQKLDGSEAVQAVVVDSVNTCSFSYEPGTNTRNGLVTLRLSLTKGGETISLLQQVHVDNAP
ncbi:type II secretion system protein [Stutzerimonas nitrititolerans]|uniref:type II secretion system protein n=1 Tax=Stutzerimonas nitrititolerans TaxID=2482751 RepID=UPI0028ABACBB|nr:type II secretion system protein [Stutzerimonas nitrititolerans]